MIHKDAIFTLHGRRYRVAKVGVTIDGKPGQVLLTLVASARGRDGVPVMVAADPSELVPAVSTPTPPKPPPAPRPVKQQYRLPPMVRLRDSFPPHLRRTNKYTSEASKPPTVPPVCPIPRSPATRQASGRISALLALLGVLGVVLGVCSWVWEPGKPVLGGLLGLLVVVYLVRVVRRAWR